MTLLLILQQAGIHQASGMKVVFKKAGRGCAMGKMTRFSNHSYGVIWTHGYLSSLTLTPKKRDYKANMPVEMSVCTSCHGLVSGQNNTCT